MKGNELARNKISSDIDPLSMTKIQTNLLEASDDKGEKTEDQTEAEKGINNGENMLLLNLQSQEQNSPWSLSLSSTSEIKLPKSHSLILRPDPKDLDFNYIESENPTAAFEENSFLDQSKFAKPDEIDEEEAKYETDYDFEVVESDFQKALELRRQRKDEVKVYKELYCISNSNDPKHPNFIYTDDQNEDEIFSKDVHMLDIVNTTFIEGKLKLTRFKLVFIPYERVKISPAEDGSTKRKNDYEYVAKKLEPHKVRYFMIPLQMISSIKDQCDK